MRSLVLLAALAMPALAAPPEPAVEIRLKSVNDLLEPLAYLGGLVGQEEQAKQGVAFVRALAGERGIFGIDPKRPVGGYALATPNVVDSPVLLMVPIKNEEAFLSLLKDQLKIVPKKGDDGIYEVQVPKVEPPVYFRFANDYAYATIRDKKSLADAMLIDPKTFFAKDDSIMSVALMLDRIPADVRKTIIGQVELQIGLEKERKAPNDTATQHKLKGVLLDGVASAFAALVTDGQSTAAKLAIDPAKDQLGLTLTTTPKAGSPLATSFAAVGARKAIAPLAAKAKDPVLAMSVNGGLSEEFLRRLTPIIDELVKEAPNDGFSNRLLEILAPTLRAGTAELGVAIGGPDGDGHYQFLSAARLKDGSALEKFAKELGPQLPGEAPRFDIEKVGAGSLHAAKLPMPEVQEKFGDVQLWVVTSDDLAVVGIAPDAARVKAVGTATAEMSDLFRAEIAVAAATFLFETKLTPGKVKELVNDVFERQPTVGKDTIRMSVTGGSTLAIAASAKGKAIKMLVALDAAKKQ